MDMNCSQTQPVLEETHNADRDHQDDISASSDSCESDQTNESSNEKDEEGEPTDIGSQAAQDKQAKEKRPRKPRKPNHLSEGSFLICRVNNRGVLVCPEKLQVGTATP
jgi:hypothetical protein